MTASELIALADEAKGILKYSGTEHFVVWQADNFIVKVEPVLRRLAANQSGSERAGVDACPHPTDSRHGSGSTCSDGSGHSEWSCSKCGHHERIDFPPHATPPAQPAPASEESTHGKPDGAVQPCDWRASEHTEGPNDCGYFTAGIDIPEPDICGRPGFHYCAIEFHSKDRATAEARRDAMLAALSPKIAAAETSPGDVLDVCPFCFGSGRHEGRFGHNDPECTNCNGVGKVAIDRLDVKVEAKSQEPEAATVQERKWKP